MEATVVSNLHRDTIYFIIGISWL